MKFTIYFTANRKPIPFNYAHQLCGVFHQWLGSNDLHNQPSLYSLGWLRGGNARKGALGFRKGARWDIGVYDNGTAERLIQGLLMKEFVFYGMNIRRIERIEPPDFSEGAFVFKAGSPVFIRRVEDDMSRTHLTWNDPDHAFHLKKVMLHKMKEAQIGTKHHDFDIRFDPNYKHPKTKLVTIKGIKNRASMCPIVMRGTPKALEFAWTVGIGELTGTGFGSLIGQEPYRGALEKTLESNAEVGNET